MPGSGGTFVLAATYPDEAAAQEDYQVVKDAHAAGLAGSCDAAVVTKDASGTVHESKVEDAITHVVTGAEKQTAQEVDVDPADIGKALQETVKEM
jgi:predicted xylose isomerase-like sugar epimerase